MTGCQIFQEIGNKCTEVDRDLCPGGVYLIGDVDSAGQGKYISDG